mmetsp:Transcript_23015/g.43511  ORF Transcript_23015/g.43511 Transcript_23015/m.43511 type:complete len:86 (+) Transcript_23015:134-391(+)
MEVTDGYGFLDAIDSMTFDAKNKNVMDLVNNNWEEDVPLHSINGNRVADETEVESITHVASSNTTDPPACAAMIWALISSTKTPA